MMNKEREIRGILLNWIMAVPETASRYHAIAHAEVNLFALQELIALQAVPVLQMPLSVAEDKVRKLEACIRGDYSARYTQEVIFKTSNNLLSAGTSCKAIQYAEIEARLSRFDGALLKGLVVAPTGVKGP